MNRVASSDRLTIIALQPVIHEQERGLSLPHRPLGDLPHRISGGLVGLLDELVRLESRKHTAQPDLRRKGHTAGTWQCLPGSQTDHPPVSPPSFEGALRKRRLWLASALAAIGAILLVCVWVGIKDQLGRTLSNHEQLEEAIAEYRTATRLKPNDAEAHESLGIALSKQGKLEDAIGEFRTAIRLRPDFPEPHYNLGLALRVQRKPEEAIAEFRTARDNTQPGSDLAQLIERALTESGP